MPPVFPISPDDPGRRRADQAPVDDKPSPSPVHPLSAATRSDRPQALKILILEDEPTDAELMVGALRKAGLQFTAKRVATRAAFVAALDRDPPDILLADYTLPDFSGRDALEHVRDTHPEVPVVMVTGTLGEEAAIELLKAGAKDYVLKSNLLRLRPSVERAIEIEQGIRARKSAETALRRSEERYRTLVTATAQLVWTTDGQGNVVDDLPHWRSFTGQSRAEIGGHGWADALHPEDREAAMKGWRWLARGRQAFEAEYRVRRRDGVYRYVSSRGVPILEEDGTVREWIGTCTDTTERKEAEAALRASHKLLETTERIAHIGGWQWDIARDRLAWSDEAYRIFGRKPAEWASTVANFIRAVHPDDRPRLQKAIAASTTNGAPFALEFRVIRPDGTERIVEARAELGRDRTGQVVAMSGTSHDITERKQAEAKIREEEAKFRSLVEQNVAGIFIIREDGTIGYVNPFFASLLGYAAADLIGRPVLEILREEERAAAREKLLIQVFGDAELVQHNVAVETRDGRRIDLLINASRSIFEGRPASLAVVLDVTEQIAAKRTLERLNRMLRTLSCGNEAVVRAVSEPELLSQMCRVIVETGGYRMAWIGIAQQDAARSLTPAAWAGEGGQYLANARIGRAEEPRGNDPCGRALRTGDPQIVQDLDADPGMAPWAEEARKYGFASAAALPLKDTGGVFALLTIYAAEPGAFDADALQLLQELADDLAYGIRALKDRAERATAVQRWQASLEATIGAIASTVEMRDPYTAGHQQRVARLAVAIARELGLSEHQIEGLYLAGIIHDVGKITIPAEILSKPGDLPRVEFQLIQAHPQAGYDVVKGVDFPWPIAEIVRQHHERLDGSGYPQGLAGEQILPEAKILAVADVVEAMMSYRPYRPALGIAAALQEITEGRGRLYDPAAVDTCIELFRRDGSRSNDAGARVAERRR